MTGVHIEERRLGEEGGRSCSDVPTSEGVLRSAGQEIMEQPVQKEPTLPTP